MNSPAKNTATEGLAEAAHEAMTCGALPHAVWQQLCDALAAYDRAAARVTGIDSIAAERRRQIDVEGWTAERDDMHGRGECAAAAACYVLIYVSRKMKSLAWSYRLEEISTNLWPWSKSWWKPKTYRADLVRAGALIAAEIDRLDRLTAQEAHAALAAAGKEGGE